MAMPTFRLGKVRRLLKDGKAKIDSRSPAVAAALAKALGESDDEFFGHDYCINNHVYTTLLKQLSERKILK